VTELTKTERRIIAEVADGRTNREIAELLLMSPKTVEWNLTRIYRKLKVRSRTELAVMFVRTRKSL
jgi:DNA-binding CsgD family transcriptional regulator